MLGLLDRRRRRPSPRTAPRAEVQRILQLYNTRSQRFTVRHFLHRGEHGVTLSSTFLKLALQAAGLVPQGRARRPPSTAPRAPRLLRHLDGRDQEGLALCPGQRQARLAVIDEATTRLLYAALWPEGPPMPC